MITKTFGGVPVNLFLPLEDVEHGALEQIITTSRHPHAVGPVAVMPDCHQGYGVTIGTILQTEGVVVPNAVGVDIGCGVAFSRTYRRYEPEVMDAAYWQQFDAAVRRRIPVGFKWHAKAQDWAGFDNPVYANTKHPERVAQQLGSLGGGNHFLEAAVGDDGFIYLLVHSGSRGFGHGVAERHQTIAQAINMKKTVKRDPTTLESLPILSEEGQAYLTEMKAAEAYAMQSRDLMLLGLLDALAEVDGAAHMPAAFTYNIAHNYAEVEAGGLVVHRKGAVAAHENEVGIIPGSMGTPTFITRGLGNPDSVCSSSHGAGRTMSRGQAKRTFSMDDFGDALAGTFSTFSETIIDESPMAYKSIEEVLARQADCVDVISVLRPIITIKGGGRDEG